MILLQNTINIKYTNNYILKFLRYKIHHTIKLFREKLTNIKVYYFENKN